MGTFLGLGKMKTIVWFEEDLQFMINLIKVFLFFDPGKDSLNQV
jgi:hypothetical protein